VQYLSDKIIFFTDVLLTIDGLLSVGKISTVEIITFMNLKLVFNFSFLFYNEIFQRYKQDNIIF